MWAQIINAALGIWLMAAPGILHYGTPAAANDRIIGPVAATFAIIAWWEVTRGARWANLPLGLWLVAAPWWLGYAEGVATANNLTVGVLLLGFSFVKGKIQKQYGGGWSALWK